MRVQPHRRAACARSTRSCFVPTVGLSSSSTVDTRNVRFGFESHFSQPHECFLVSRFSFTVLGKTPPRRIRLCRRTCTDAQPLFVFDRSQTWEFGDRDERHRPSDQVRLSFPLPNELHRVCKRLIHGHGESGVGPVAYS